MENINLETNNNLENKELSQEVLEIGEKQNDFLNSTVGKVINETVDLGLRWILPDFLENQVIDVKDALIKGGLKEGVNETVKKSIEMGKNLKGVFTGKFENISEAHDAIKNGGTIDGISNVIDSSLNIASKNKLIPNNVASLIRKGKNVILDNISNNIEENFTYQINNIEKIGKYENNWKNFYNEHDFDGMEREYQKIKEKLKETLPLEKTLKEARVIENLHTLIKNNGGKFDLTNEQIELSKLLTN